MLSLPIVWVYYTTKFCCESLFHMQDSNINEHTHATLDINTQAIFFKYVCIKFIKKISSRQQSNSTKERGVTCCLCTWTFFFFFLI
jgi:hypothetical protein